jgi:hypothetical protein
MYVYMNYFRVLGNEESKKLITRLLFLYCMYPSKRKMDALTTPTDLVDPFHGAQKNDSKKQHKKLNPRACCELVIYVLLWYTCSIITITSTKSLMMMGKFPFSLCASQFTVATACSYLYLRCTNTLKVASAAAKSIMLRIAVSYTFGFVVTNIAFSLGNIVKSTE